MIHIEVFFLSQIEIFFFIYLTCLLKMMLRSYFLNITYNVCLEKGSDQLIVTRHAYAISIYPCVHNQLIRTILEAHVVSYKKKEEGKWTKSEIIFINNGIKTVLPALFLPLSRYRENYWKPCFHAVFYKGTMSRLVQIDWNLVFWENVLYENFDDIFRSNISVHIL